MIGNKYSGTLHINNLTHLNKLYDIMKEALMQDNTINMGDHGLVNPYSSTLSSNGYYNNINSLTGQPGQKPHKLFMTVKGQKIFNIIKDSVQPNRRKSVQIVYNNEDYGENNHKYGYPYETMGQNMKEDDYTHNEKDDGYYEQAREEDNENEEQVDEEQPNPEGQDYIYGNYPSWTNMFK